MMTNKMIVTLRMVMARLKRDEFFTPNRSSSDMATTMPAARKLRNPPTATRNIIVRAQAVWWCCLWCVWCVSCACRVVCLSCACVRGT